MADQGAGEVEQAEVDVGSAFVAGPESFEGVEPGEAAFDDPAVFPEAGAVASSSSGQVWSDAECAEAAAVWLGVIAPVSVERPGAVAGLATTTPDRRDRLH